MASTPAVVPPWPGLWVSSDLHYLDAAADEAAILSRDFTQVDADGVCRAYRRLDPTWYAWLAARMAQAERLNQTTAGGLHGITVARERFAVVQAWAGQRYGQDILAGAMRVGIASGYKSPQIFRHYVPHNQTACPKGTP